VEGTGNGTITIDGSGTKVTLNPVGQSDVLDSGNWGIGSVTISGGAVVDGTNTASCAPGWCLSKVTNGAGSTGTLNVTGSGSMLSVPNLLIVGFDVVNQVTPAPVFGTPGGASSGTLNVKAGGTLNTQDATIGLQATNSVPPALGTETASGTAVVDGAGSTWNATSPDNSGIAIGQGSNPTGSLSITNGGAVNIAATSPSLQAGISIGGTGGSPGGTGSLTVNGGSLTFATGDTFLNVGRNQGSGTMVVEGGGTVSGGLATDVGRDGSTGSLTLNGAGSSLTLSGTSTTSGAFLGIGIVDTPALAPTLGPSTVGNLTVQNGGKITLDTDNNLNGGMNVGQNGGTGNLTITGAGSQLVISGNNSNTNTGGGASVGRSGNGYAQCACRRTIHHRQYGNNGGKWFHHWRQS
jgi:T5SS/PEP-CTERM-associated repeat protein